MKLKLISLEAMVFEGEVGEVTLQGSNGQLTLLPGHTFLLSGLSPGKVKCRTAAGERIFETERGLLEVDQDMVTVVVDRSASA